MNRNVLYLVIGALIVIVAFLGYRYYQDQQRSGITIEMDEGGMSIDSN